MVYSLKKGTKRVTAGEGMQTFDFIEGDNYPVRNAVSTGIPYVNSYEFFGWIFDDDVCIPFGYGSATTPSYVMEFDYNPNVNAYLKTGNNLPPNQLWSVQISYTWGNVVPSTLNRASSDPLQCLCPINTRQTSDGSCRSPCNPGYYTATDGSCAICQQGSYCESSVSRLCPLGKSSIAGSSVCSPCGGSSDVQLYMCGLLTSCTAATPMQLPGSVWFGVGNIVSGVGGQGLVPTTPWFAGSAVAGMVLNAGMDRPYSMLQQTVSLPDTSPVAFQFKIMCAGVACSQVEFQVQWSNDTRQFNALMNVKSIATGWTVMTLPFVSPLSQQITIRIIAQLSLLSSTVWISEINILTLGRWTIPSDLARARILNESVTVAVSRSYALSTLQEKSALLLNSTSVVWMVSENTELILPQYRYYATVSAEGEGVLTISTSESVSESWTLTRGSSSFMQPFVFNTGVTPTMFKIQTVGAIVISGPRLTLRSPYTECQECLSDYWCSNQLIFECPVNSASAALSTRQTDCWCVAGYYGLNNSLIGYTPCSLCPVNYFCTGGNTVSVCPPGTKSGAGSSVCSQCDAGEFCQNGQVGVCPLHSHSPAGSNELSDCICDNGYYGSAPDCVLCEVASYCMDGARMSCVANAISVVGAPDSSACFCDKGYYGNGSQLCIPCEEGSWCWTGVKNLCAANMWSPAQSSFASNCTCTFGYHRADTRACVPCETGTFKPTRSDDACTLCDVGTYSVASAATSVATCAQCPAGTFNDLQGQYQCQQCAAGYYARNFASTACEACWAGSYSASGAGQCTSCGAGTMSSAVAASSASVCEACVVGSWSSGNTSSCNICGTCSYWSYPPAVFFYVLNLLPVATGISDNVNFAVLHDSRVLMSQLSALWFVDLSSGVAAFTAVTVPGVGGPFMSLASSRIAGYAYAVQGMYTYRIDLLRGAWDVVYPSALATCVLEDAGLVWIVQQDSVRALDEVSTAVVRSFPMVGSHHICIHALYSVDAFVTGSYGLKRINRVTGVETPLLMDISYSLCAFTPDGNFIVLYQPESKTAWAYSISDQKLTKVLNNAILTDMYADNSTIVFASQNSGIQNVSYALADSRTCGPGKFSAYSGLQLESQCQVCPAGSLCPGGANITQCAPGTYSLATGIREQGQCLVCPSGYSCSGGNDLTVCPLGSYSPGLGIIGVANCPACEAGHFCPNSTTSVQCPPNTMSIAGQSDLGDCTCNAGYRCVYVRVMHAEITLPIPLSQFTDDMRNRYVLAIALAAGVDISNVQIVAVQQVTLTGGGRRMLEFGMEAVEIHTSVYNALEDTTITTLDKHLVGLGLPSHRGFQMSIHMEVVDSVLL